MNTRRPTGSVVVLAALLVAVGALVIVGFSGHGGPPTRAQQAHAIAASVRCPVCKDLSAADSPAPLARQMRAQIRSRLAAGATPAQIRREFVAAYGPSVLMSPPDRGWGRAVRLAPFAVLGAGVLLGGLLVRRALAAGRVDEADHARLRPVLVGQAAASVPTEPRAHEDRLVSLTRSGTHRGRRWLVAVALGVAATVGVSTLLVGALDHRAPGAAATGDQPSPDRLSADKLSPDRLSADQLATLQAAVEAVKQRPQQAAPHVDLARAYTEAGQPQLAAVEYLAATHLDPDNPEANTALALVAFEAGSAQQADRLVSKVLAAHPTYPEALYTRGLIRAMGLHRPAAATRDLKAYRKAAPLGSHRTTVATVLALLGKGAIE